MTIRKIAGLVTALLMMAALMPLMAAPAFGDEWTGTVPNNCVKFEVGDTGTQSPIDFPGVDITINSWVDTDEGFSLTVAGLEAGQTVTAYIKSGQDQHTAGPYGNGTHQVDGPSTHGISHVTFCVHEETTTTTEDTTTTTEQESTTTTEQESTTTTEQESTTTTEQESTTTTEQESTTTTEQESTTTTETEVEEATTSTTEVEPEVAQETTSTTEAEEETTSTTEDETDETLPFTGAGTDGIALAALVALASGAGLIFLTRGNGEGEIEV